jgi:serine/threonine protein phosphatase PrpC
LNNIQQITYDANAPTEDRLVIGELKQINGYIISIFDGHGGCMLSDYASHKITDLIE